jgi:hypothetical protein
VPRHGARTGRQAADLGAIRRTDAVLDLLASRRRIPARVFRDPAIALLRSLAADVDAAPRPGRRGRPAVPCRAAVPRRRTGRHHAPGAWPHAAAAAAVATAIAMLAAMAAVGLVVAGTLGQFVCGRWHIHRSRT